MQRNTRPTRATAAPANAATWNPRAAGVAVASWAGIEPCYAHEGGNAPKDDQGVMPAADLDVGFPMR